MQNLRQLYIQHVAQTSEMSMMLPIEKAEGMYIYTSDGKKYLDLNSGISVSSLGHRHPAVIEALKGQMDKYLHTMVYGEHLQQPQVDYARLLSDTLDNGLESVYYLNSGTEAVETAIKLARKHTRRYEIISASNAYHGSTIAAESLRSDHDFTRSFVPGIPGISHIDFNDVDQLSKITDKTSCVIMEPVQAESGVYIPLDGYLQKVKQRCEDLGALFILDEIQTGFGRTGHLFAYQKYNVTPDILLIGKAMGGGMPISAVVSTKEIMSAFAKKPALGHITTFGGHPVTVAGAHATLKTLINTRLYEEVSEKEALFHRLLIHPIIENIRSSGLMMAVQLTKRKYLKHVVNHIIEKGALVDYFLFNDRSFRLAPPLIISQDEIKKGCSIIMEALDYAEQKYKR